MNEHCFRQIVEILKKLGFDKPTKRGNLYVIEDDVYVTFNERRKLFEAWSSGAAGPEVEDVDPVLFAEKLKTLF